MGYRSYKNPLNKASLRTVTGWGKDPSYSDVGNTAKVVGFIRIRLKCNGTIIHSQIVLKGLGNHATSLKDDSGPPKPPKTLNPEITRITLMVMNNTEKDTNSNSRRY